MTEQPWKIFKWIEKCQWQEIAFCLNSVEGGKKNLRPKDYANLKLPDVVRNNVELSILEAVHTVLMAILECKAAMRKKHSK